MAERELKPWFKTKGRTTGDRTLEQQLLGLDDLRARVAGKTLLDVGCAEGLISMRLFDEGAKAVHGLEVRPDFVKVANKLRGDRACTFEVADANDYEPVRDYDIVIMLAVLHKLRDPSAVAKRFASAAREMVVLRTPPTTPATVVDDRSGSERHHVGAVIVGCGFMLKNSSFTGPKGEWVGHYERVAP